MKQFNVALLGASGAVGKEILKVLEERDFPIAKLKLLSSARSAGKTIKAFHRELVFEEINENSFKGIDIVLSAVANVHAKKWIPVALKSGAIVIDNSSAFRNESAVPLVIPQINGRDIFKHEGLIANPNCATIIALMAIAPLHEYALAKRIIISTYQAVSGAGLQGMEELESQMHSIIQHEPIEISQFPYQIANNLIPQIGNFNEDGYSEEEMKLQFEGRKILHHDDLKISCTCVRVPVMRSHSESITVEFENEMNANIAKKILSEAPGVKIVDNLDLQQYPMPIDTSDQDKIFVGRIRNDISTDKNSISFWCCGDQLRKGAATNAVEIAERLI